MSSQETGQPADYLRALLDSIPSPIFCKDRQGLYRECNPAFERMLGLKREQIIGKTVYEVSPTDLADKYHQMDLDLMREGIPQTYEFSVRFADGQRHDVIFNKAVVQDPHRLGGESALGLVGVMLDITDRKTAERELEYRHRMTHLSCEISQDFLDCNPDQTDEAIAIALKKIGLFFGARSISINLDENHNGILTETIRWQNDLTSKLPKIAHDNSELKIPLTHKGNLFGLLLLSSQQERRQWSPVEIQTLEIVGRTLQSLLVRQAIMATLDAQRVHLVQQAKMSALGEMASGIAHEINNPLTIISLSAQHLRHCLPAHDSQLPQVAASLDRIERTGGRIAAIIRGLRAFAKDGYQDPVKRTSMRSIVKDTLVFCEARFHHHSVTLRHSEIPDSLMVECRPVQIAQVLLNLLNNAFDAVENIESRWIEVIAQDLGDAVELSVVNSGPPIPAEIIDKLTQPFFTTKDPGRGTGLGLSISKGIVEEHKGHLFYDRQFGHTCFKVVLPKSMKTNSSQSNQSVSS